MDCVVGCVGQKGVMVCVVGCIGQTGVVGCEEVVTAQRKA